MGIGSNHDKDSPPAADARLRVTPADQDAITRIGDFAAVTCPTCNRRLQSEYTVCPYDGTPLSDKYAIGNKISGKYEILEQIGAGGMGIVYKVRQTLVNRVMALKRMHAKLLSEEGLIRFQQEAKATFKLHHKNIVSVHDFDFYDGDPYLAMEFVDGKPLSKLIQEQVRLPLDVTLEIAIQICDALAHAHESGVLHRDLKPANIMIVTAGVGDQTRYVPKVLDFGIAKSLDTVSGDTQQLTKTGQAVGSPLYMSPEQCEGKKVDQRSDIYSLGCVIYECLTSLPPLHRDTVLSTMMAHIHEKPLSLKEASLGTEYPFEIELIVGRLLEKNPEMRYQCMREVEDDLRKVQTGSRPAITVPVEPAKNVKTRFNLKSTGLIVLLFACTLSAAVLIGYHQSEPRSNHTITPSIAATQNEEENISSSKTDKLIGYLIDTGKLSDPVDFSGSDITDDGLRILSTIKSIHKVNVSNTGITDKGLGYLAGLSNINVLDLSNTKISDASAGSLGRLKGLEALFVGNNRSIGTNLISHLNGLPVLLELDLRNTQITDQDIANLPEQAKVLKELDIGNNRVTDEGIVYCGKLRYLMNLDVSGTSLSDAGLRALANNHDLTTLDVSSTNITSAGLSALLPGCRLLHSLSLDNDDITDASIDGISELKSLEHLDIRNTQVTDAGLLKLARCKTLMDLSLQGSKVTPSGIQKFKQLCPTVDLVQGYPLNHLVLWLPTDRIPSSNTIAVYLAQAKQLMSEKKYNESIVECNKALLAHDTKERQNESGFEQANQIKAECLAKLGRRAEAAKEAERLDRIGDAGAASAIKRVLDSK
jgi:serine/threonine-protein kinase